MKRVQILMSAYNGEKSMERQVRSIMAQKGAAVHLLIRDDGSKDGTAQLVKKLQGEYPDAIELVSGQNMGWKKSFLELIALAGDYDYYGFSDQDDYWYEDKLIHSIRQMDDGKAGVKLTHVNSVCTDENLNPRPEQQARYPQPRSRKAAIAQEYWQGCSMLWNREAMALLKRYRPQGDVAHDYWVGTVCYYFGSVYYCPEPQFCHIRYETNSSCDGNVEAGRKKRMAMLKSGNTVYMNPAQDLLEGYGDLLTAQDRRFLEDICQAKGSLAKRLKLAADPAFRRESLKSTLFFKLLLLQGKF